jgi:hypothetical protein
MKRRIYVASSWRNKQQPAVVEALCDAGHEVYDFRNPVPEKIGFAWSMLDPDFQHWDLRTYVHNLHKPLAGEHFKLDADALDWCDTCVLVLPCGRSAHLELGYAIGQGKRSIIMLSTDQFTAELMYLLAGEFVTDIAELLAALQ